MMRDFRDSIGILWVVEDSGGYPFSTGRSCRLQAVFSIEGDLRLNINSRSVDIIRHFF